jgi:hypothetical protein
VLLELRRVDPDLRLAGSAARAEVEVGEGGAVEVERRPLEEVGRLGAPVRESEEGLEPRGLLRRELRPRVLDCLLDERRLRLLGLQ